MSDFPTDIFTEQDDVDPDTLANLGPLRRLAGVWESQKGVDVSPKAPGPDRRVYIERAEFQPIDPQSNGPQTLYGLRYHIHITTREELITFHDQVGYWLWEAATGLVMQTLTIPRGQTALATGMASPGDDHISVSSVRGSTENGICSTAFLEYAFRTDAYKHDLTFNADGTLTYVQTTTLKVRGNPEPFPHRDQNKLVKTGEAKPNPMMLRLAAAKAGVE
ncbi:MAG: heme-binding beta-barrel domain-containing protein [Proteobacteria bacterium]|nr:heme-binding beta-barrel domain-containing protein [Pseudomonadota bacterium]